MSLMVKNVKAWSYEKQNGSKPVGISCLDTELLSCFRVVTFSYIFQVN